MTIEFPLPDVGEGLAEAEIVRWLVAVGDAVREDDAIVEIETDKALVQITSPVTGTLARHGAREGETLAVGGLLAVFEGAGDPASAGNGATPVTPAATTKPATPAVTGGGAAPSRKPKATPATRKLARQLGVELTAVTGSGAGGRILDDDVQRAADGGPAPSDPVLPTPAPAPAAAPSAPSSSQATPDGRDERVALRGIRRAVARTMTTSWTTVPHVNSIHEVDLHALQQLRAELSGKGHKLPMTAFIVRAAALALREFPVLNAEIDVEAEEMVLKHRRNIGVAVDAPDGLMVPVIEDADTKSVGAIATELGDLAAQARDRSVPAERLRGGTFTVNNYGPLGGWFGTSLVKPPEVGILSMGPAVDRVVPRDGEIVVRPVGVMTLAADHRVADGRELIGFCLAVRHRLEAPLTLLVEE